MGFPAESQGLGAAPDHTFPPLLAEVPEGERAGERFGWIPALLAVLIGGFGAWGLTEKRPALAVVAGCFAVAALLAFFELKRRRERTFLVRRDGRIGIYRKGALSQAVGLGQVTRMFLRHGNTLQHLMVPVVLMGAGGALVVNPGKAGQDLLPFALGLFAIGAAGAGSLVRTRLLLHHFYLPKGKRSENVLLSRDDSEKLFGKDDRSL